MDNILVIENEGCATFVQKTYETCLPVRRYCNMNVCDGLLADACDRCQGEPVYGSPYIKGEKIQIQTKYFDTWSTDRECPTIFGLEVQLCDLNGNIVSSTLSAFLSDYVSGWTGEYSYQTICIDTSLAIFDNLKCWTLRFSNGIAEQDCDSIPFQEIKEGMDSFVIESDKSIDCFNNHYGTSECFGGTSNFEYSNRLRIRGKLEKLSSETPIEKFGMSTTTVESRKYYFINLAKGIPIHIDCLLQNILSGNNITVNGKTAHVDSIPRSQLSGSTVIGGYEVYEKCSHTNGCN